MNHNDDPELKPLLMSPVQGLMLNGGVMTDSSFLFYFCIFKLNFIDQGFQGAQVRRGEVSV